MLNCSHCGAATEGQESSPGVTSAICDKCLKALTDPPEVARAAARGKTNEAATAEAHTLLKEVRSHRRTSKAKKPA